MKNEVLILFSEKGEEYAEVLQEELQNISHNTLEKQVLGIPMQTKLDKLLKQLEVSDFGIVVLTNDYIEDDNAMFLIGLLIGNLGIGRFALLIPSNAYSCIACDYLKGLEPNYYNTDHPNKKATIGQSIVNVKRILESLHKRKKQHEYNVLENKKELLRIALDSYTEVKERYNPFLAHLVDVFHAEYKFIKGKALGATIFVKKDNEFEQIATAGIVKSNHNFSLEDDDKYVVQCYKQQNIIILNEKFGRFPDDERVYEYIFCKNILKEYVLTVHIKCHCKIEDKVYGSYLESLQMNNAGYISILQLFLKGGNIL